MNALKHIIRRLARTPMFTGAALVTLALGIGANTAIFSVINGVLLKPLPYPNPDALVGVWHVAPGIPSIAGKVNCSPTMYFTYREESRTFHEFGIWSNGGASVTGLAEPEQVRAVFVTKGVLDALGVHPSMGRWFSDADTQPEAALTVLLTYAYWQRRLGGDTSVIGRNLTIDGKPHAVIGVMPKEFQFPNSNAEVILPQQFDRAKIFLGNFSYQGIARLKPGTTLDQANADVTRMLGIWMKAWPTPPGFDAKLFENARL